MCLYILSTYIVFFFFFFFFPFQLSEVILLRRKLASFWDKFETSCHFVVSSLEGFGLKMMSFLSYILVFWVHECDI